MPCYANTKKKVKVVCDPRCGNSTHLDSLEAEQEKAEEDVRINVMMDKLDSTCTYGCPLKCTYFQMKS